jgi:lipoprotein-anchoring transpeptidase ErfK/SrfK
MMVTGPLPKDWNAKAKMAMVGYQSLVEVVCERFHCSQALLARLNPRVNTNALKEGQVLAVPAVYPAKSAHAARLEIDLSQKVIRGYDSSGQQVALFHCSIAKDVAKRPRGEAHVVSVTREPSYSFDPAMWPEVKNVKSKLLINPGPRNPVGLCWIALSLRGYGIHGTPNPEMIGKTGSHGCFRLTNWDALRLGSMLSPHTPIKFIS